jgi:hypothetical protein
LHQLFSDFFSCIYLNGVKFIWILKN